MKRAKSLNPETREAILRSAAIEIVDLERKASDLLAAARAAKKAMSVALKEYGLSLPKGV